MNKTIFLLLALLSCPALARAACEPGVYGSGASAFVVLVPVPNAGTGLRYLFLDGRRGMTSDADSLVACAGDQVRVGDATANPPAGRASRSGKPTPPSTASTPVSPAA